MSLTVNWSKAEEELTYLQEEGMPLDIEGPQKQAYQL